MGEKDGGAPPPCPETPWRALEHPAGTYRLSSASSTHVHCNILSFTQPVPHHQPAGDSHLGSRAQLPVCAPVSTPGTPIFSLPEDVGSSDCIE